MLWQRIKVEASYRSMNGSTSVFLFRAFYRIRRISSIQVGLPLLRSNTSTHLSWQNNGHLLGLRAADRLVAELLVIRQATLKKKKSIVVLPFVSIVTEKTKHFRNLVDAEKVEVASFHGGARAVGVWDIAICTFEKVTPLRLCADCRQIP